MQVYGFGGELLAEYAANGPATSPQKEYGYRNGQLLITAEPAPPTAPSGPNFAAASNGATATASSTYSSVTAANANNGDHVGTASWWADNTSSAYPDWLQVEFAGSKTISEIDVYGVQQNYGSPVEPTLTMTSPYALTNFEMQYWTGSTWATVSGGSVTGNDKVWRKFTFAPLTTSKIRVYITNVAGDNHSQIVELEAYGPFNVAAATNGATASASSTYSTAASAANANNGDHVGAGSWWADDTSNTYPDWLQVEFAGAKTISEIDVYGVQQNYSSPVEPTPTMTSPYALTNFEVQYWTGSAWTTVPGGSITGNDKVWRKLTFVPLTTSKIRVYVTNVTGDNHSQVVELEAYTASSSALIEWLVTDHLGTPRIILDQTGKLENVKRHDYLPFGEELFAPTAGRSAAQGYSTGDGLRQQFTQKERDIETGLDYFGARYFSSVQGRFVGIDPLMSTGNVNQPQSWNRYSYAHNTPLISIDVDGLYVWGTGATEERKTRFRAWLADLKRARDSYDPTSDEYKRLNNILLAYGDENKGDLAVRFDTENFIGEDLGNVNALAHTTFLSQGNRVIAQQEITFNTNRLDEVQISTVAHEGQHIVDDRALASTLIIKQGKLVATNPNLNRTEFQTEDRGFEAGQFASAGLHRNDIRWAGTQAPSALYLNSWVEPDKAALKASMSRARLEYLRRWYHLTPENQGPKTVP